ncbi:MAG: tRNA lysidine(34) synthetase TilS [Phycisphaeraceae bacterium]|nr:tRNA lysidine(34) synthetase TilS [Phycisphaeraceae bacterium]
MAASESEHVPAQARRRAEGDRPGGRPRASRDLIAEVSRRLFSTCGLPRDATILLAVSGGADSTALALACTAIARRRSSPIRPVIAHVHHHLRGASADADAAHVEALAARLSRPFVRLDVYPGADPGNRLAAARRHRLAALAACARAHGAVAVATGHQADDQLETLLAHLLRGTGSAGLRGLRWRRPIDVDRAPPVHLVRPLLSSPRAACSAFCVAEGVACRDDPSNEDPARLRTRLRSGIVPLLEAIRPGVARRATGTAEMIGVAHAALRRAARGCLGPAGIRRWERAALRPLAPALIAFGLRRAFRHSTGTGGDRLSWRTLERIADAVRDDVRRPRRFRLPRGIVVLVTHRTVALEDDGPVEASRSRRTPDA